MSGTLADKVAIVTGGSRGIGRAVAVAFAAEGAAVAVVHASPLAGDAVVQAIQSRGGKARAWQADMADTAAVDAMVEEVLAHFGRVDILVNNAGITKDGPFVRMKDADFDRVIAVNLRGCFACARAVSRPMMKQRGGRIINVSSVVGLHGNAGQANYAAAKAGIVGLTKALARELASRSVTVNAVAPGTIDTDMTQAIPEAARAALIARIPLGRIGTPQDLTGVFLLLASEAGAYITGQVIQVDGGLFI
jgi:3-oxoacyl-[acyl-carrier protein] reductase